MTELPHPYVTYEERPHGVPDTAGTLDRDPACDLIPRWMFLPARARDAFRTAVAMDGATWARARGLALAGSLPVPDGPFFAVPGRVTAALRRLDAVLDDHAERG